MSRTPHDMHLPVPDAFGPGPVRSAEAAGERAACQGVRWVEVAQCPVCGAAAALPEGGLPDQAYVYGGRRVPLPAAGVSLFRCGACGLAYKSPLPHPDDLLDVFRAHAGAVWSGAQGFATELDCFERLAGSTRFDLLDVGAADGALLAARARREPGGRRAALDVICYEGLRDALSGEFIDGFLDAPQLRWSGRPYAMVAMLDVAEHLYRPRLAFANLARLVERGGHVLIESGDTTSPWARRYGLHNWWYARLLEHHVFWSREPLERIAAEHGFAVVDWERACHRRDSRSRPAAVLWELLKSCTYRLTPQGYARIANRFGHHGNQPSFPFSKDHFRCALKKL